MSRLIIDVREPNEFQSGHVQGAINIPSTKLLSGTKQLDGIAKDTELILYCRSGARSNASIQILRNMGYANLTNGINAEQVRSKYFANM